MSKQFKLPTKIKVSQRISSITNAFFNGIIPVLKPTDVEINKHLSILGMSETGYKCVYCGGEATTSDHLNPLVREKKPTGYITEIGNLVPSCNGCNQSKGNKNWRDFIDYLLKNSKNDENRKSISEKQYSKVQNTLENFEKTFKPEKINFDNQEIQELLKLHLENYNTVIAAMNKSIDIERELTDKLKNMKETFI